MYLSDEMKELLVKKIVEAINPKKVILFGSYADGTATEDSDIDILVVEKEIRSKIEEKRKIRTALREIRIAKDILIATEKEFDFYKKDFGSVIKDAFEKGIELWSS